MRPMRGKIVDGPTGLVQEFEDGELVRVSVQAPSRMQPGLSVAAHDEVVTVHHFGDHALAERVIRLKRSIEDAQRLGKDARADERDLHVTEALQRVRSELRTLYGARDAFGPPGDQGTDVYNDYVNGIEPPSYALAFMIDHHRARLGQSHVVAWKDKAATA